MNLGSLCNSTEDYDKIDLDAHLNPSFCSIVISTRLVLLIFAFVFFSVFFWVVIFIIISRVVLSIS